MVFAGEEQGTSHGRADRLKWLCRKQVIWLELAVGPAVTEARCSMVDLSGIWNLFSIMTHKLKLYATRLKA